MESDVIIAVMGLTGVGKSTFVQNITGREDIIVGHNLVRETTEVCGYSFVEDDVTYTLVDTPGFNDTYEPDEIVASKISQWITSNYCKERKLNAIVYIHSIAAPRLQGSAYRTLRIFRKLCGKGVLDNVILTTSFWSTAEKVEAEEKERELIEQDHFWGDMVKLGARVMRIDADRQSALKVFRTAANNARIDIQPQGDIVRNRLDSIYPHEHSTSNGSHLLAPSITTASWATTAESHSDFASPEALVQSIAELDTIMNRRKQVLRWELNKLEESLIQEEQRAVTQRRERKRNSKSYKCVCELKGKPFCASCRRLVTNVGSVYYHCCFCVDRKTFLHCQDCGNECNSVEHPYMEPVKTYCIVM